ncbi:MAG: phosphate ABC transporter substrate-binding protein [Clostridia bacterium]|nr:phosphate ABC transporter substrate-binding protein [Clostridia bacterium]
MRCTPRSTAVICMLAFTLVLSTGLASARSQVTVQGSTTVLPIVQRMAEEFMKENPSVSMSVRGGGSGNGLAALIDSTVQIAMASRFIKPEEVKRAIANDVYPVPFRIALDGIAVVVNSKNPVDKLTLAQLKSVYTGEITNWKQLGGPDLKIVAVSRDTSSGTYEVYEELVMKGARVAPDALLQASNGAVVDVVSRTPGAIGYVGLGYLASNLKAVKVGVSDKAYVQPSLASVQSGQYPIARNLYVFTKDWPTGDSARFIDFMLSPAGQKVVREEGFVPLW